METNEESIPILPANVPVEMPDLPPRLVITTAEQLRALGDDLRLRILGILQTQAVTAKQLAERLGSTPGAIGYHLRLLEETGLIQVVARRQVRGIVAKYYTRTARIFDHKLSSEISGADPFKATMLRQAWGELTDTIDDPSAQADSLLPFTSFPHLRLSAERARQLSAQLAALIDELVNEPTDPNGEVYGLCLALFRSPDYLQSSPSAMNEEEA